MPQSHRRVPLEAATIAHVSAFYDPQKITTGSPIAAQSNICLVRITFCVDYTRRHRELVCKVGGAQRASEGSVWMHTETIGLDMQETNALATEKRRRTDE